MFIGHNEQGVKLKNGALLKKDRNEIRKEWGLKGRGKSM